MMRQLRMTWFQIRQYIAVPYFIQIMAFTTISMTVLQVLAYHAWGGDPRTLWMRAGIIGVWTTSTSAAGILGFERYKGTLVHLVVARINPLRPLAAVVSAAATFGLVAIALAWLTWCLATMSWGGVGIGTGAGIGTGGWLAMFARLTLGIVLLWISCLSVTFVVACIFVLTPNAIAYEELLLQPILIFSGILFTTSKAPILVDLVGYLIPMKIPAQLLLAPASAQGATLWSATAWSLLSSALWFVLAGVVGRIVLVRARKTATLEVI